MRVELKTVSVRTYVFTEEERKCLTDIGLWNFIVNRLEDNERIEIVS